jgi:hypothetical protein
LIRLQILAIVKGYAVYFLECVGTGKSADRKKERRPSSEQKGSVEMTTQLMRKPYPSDLTDAQWAILVPFIPEPAADSPRQPIA